MAVSPDTDGSYPGLRSTKRAHGQLIPRAPTTIAKWEHGLSIASAYGTYSL